MPSEFVLFATVWVALVLLVVAEAGKGPLATSGRPTWWARPAWITGGVLAIVHAFTALVVRYNGDHEAAVQATAAQAASIYGLGWRGSIYVNYLFLVLWLVAAWSWQHWAWRALVATMVINGAIVFARPVARPFGVMLAVALCWAWWPRRPRATAHPQLKTPIGD
jgi:hypothetical protein